MDNDELMKKLTPIRDTLCQLEHQLHEIYNEVVGFSSLLGNRGYPTIFFIIPQCYDILTSIKEKLETIDKKTIHKGSPVSLIIGDNTKPFNSLEELQKWVNGKIQEGIDLVK